MKSAFFTLLAAAVFCSATITHSQEEETPTIPVGTLSAFPTIVQTGTKPQLTWDITLPEGVDDIIEISGNGIIVPKRCLIMDIRVLGAPIKRPVYNDQGEVEDWSWVLTEAQFNYHAQGFNRIFFDTHEYINPNEIVYSQAVAKDTILTFGGRYAENEGTWSEWLSSTNSGRVVALMDGDTPPTNTPFSSQAGLEPFMLPYLDDNGNINLGAREAIVLMELTHSDPEESGYDLQDLVLLVSFYDEISQDGGLPADCEDLVTHPGNGHAKGNNGHGNNVDGVDMSNPGSGPQHDMDTDATVDDEKKRGRRKK